MVEKRQVGNSLIGFGSFLVFLGGLFFFLVYFGFLPNQQWIFFWVTTYRAAFGSVIVGAILLVFGAYVRSTLEKYVQKVELLEEAKKAEEEKHRAKAIALGKAKARARRKELALKLTRGKLKKARLRAKRREAMLRAGES